MVNSPYMCWKSLKQSCVCSLSEPLDCVLLYHKTMNHLLHLVQALLHNRPNKHNSQRPLLLARYWLMDKKVAIHGAIITPTFMSELCR